MVIRFFILMLIAVAPGFAQTGGGSATDSLSAYVDRTQVSVNDVFILTIRVDSTLTNSMPQLSELEQDFERIAISRSNNYTNVNGEIQSWNEYRISLRPRTAGTLTIPAFTIEGQRTDPIEISVGEASPNPVNANDDIFLATTVNKERVYVQEELVYTVKLYYRTGFDQGAQLSSPRLANAVIQQLGNDQNYQEIIDGIRYNVTERKFVIFPQSSGDVEIAPISFNATVGRRRSSFNSLFSDRNAGGREVELSGEAHAITVLPKPAAFPDGATWLPASSLILEEEWSGPTDNLAIGESITRNLTLTAVGLSSSLLPDFSYQDNDGLKFYPDQPDREDAVNQNGVTGSRSEGTAIVPSRAGEFTLPAVEIPWWNTSTDSLEIARLPARTLSVTGTAALAPDSVAPLPGGLDSPANDDSISASAASGSYFYWILATAAFAMAWLVSTTLWMRDRQQLRFAGPAGSGGNKRNGEASVKPPGIDKAFREFRRACDDKRLLDIKRHLIVWGQVYFDDPAILSLEDLKRHIRQDSVRSRMRELETALYSPDPEAADFNPKALLKEITAIHTGRRHAGQSTENRYGLPPLYRN